MKQLMELIVDLLDDGEYEFASGIRNPKWLNYTLGVILSLFAVLIIYMLISLSIMFINEEHYIICLLIIGFIIYILYVWYDVIIKKIRSLKNEK